VSDSKSRMHKWRNRVAFLGSEGRHWMNDGKDSTEAVSITTGLRDVVAMHDPLAMGLHSEIVL
jgi:hypothetical protein